MSNENDLDATIAAAAAADKKKLYDICTEYGLFADGNIKNDVDSYAKAIYDIWSNKDRSSDKRKIKDEVGVKTSGIINGLVREIGNKNVLTNQARAAFSERRNGNMNFVPPVAPPSKTAAPKNSYGIGSMQDAGKVVAAQQKTSEQQRKENTEKAQKAELEAKQKITEAKVDSMYTTDNRSSAMDNINVRAAENNYKSVSSSAASIADAEIKGGKFTMADAKIKNMDYTNKVTDKNASKTAENKSKNVKIPSLAEVRAEFGADAKKVPMGMSVTPFMQISSIIKEKTALLIQKRSLLSTSKTQSHTITNTRGNVYNKGASRG